MRVKTESLAGVRQRTMLNPTRGNCVATTKAVCAAFRLLGVHAEPLAVRARIVEPGPDVLHSMCGYSPEEIEALFTDSTRGKQAAEDARRIEHQQKHAYFGHLVAFIPKLSCLFDGNAAALSVPSIGFHAPESLSEAVCADFLSGADGCCLAFTIGKYDLRYSVRKPDDGSWKDGYDRMDSGVLARMTADMLTLWDSRARQTQERESWILRADGPRL